MVEETNGGGLGNNYYWYSALKTHPWIETEWRDQELDVGL